MKALTLNIKVHSGLLFLLDNYNDNEMPPTDYIKLTQDKVAIQVGTVIKLLDIMRYT